MPPGSIEHGEEEFRGDVVELVLKPDRSLGSRSDDHRRDASRGIVEVRYDELRMPSRSDRIRQLLCGGRIRISGLVAKDHAVPAPSDEIALHRCRCCGMRGTYVAVL